MRCISLRSDMQRAAASKHTASSLCLMGVDVEKDAKDGRKLVLHTSPVPTNIRCADEE